MIARLPEMHRQLRELAGPGRRCSTARARPPTADDAGRRPDRILIDRVRTSELARRVTEARRGVRAHEQSAERRPSADALDRRRPTAPTGTIGLLAGSGRFPILFAEAARRQGLQVACVGIRYEAPDELRDLCDSFEIVGVSKLGGMIRAFRRQGVRAGRDGGQGHQERDVHALAVRPALARLPDAPDVVSHAAAATTATTRSCSA